jgi:hypothetical protein
MLAAGGISEEALERHDGEVADAVHRRFLEHELKRVGDAVQRSDGRLEALALLRRAGAVDHQEVQRRHVDDHGLRRRPVQRFELLLEVGLLHRRLRSAMHCPRQSGLSPGARVKSSKTVWRACPL